MVESWDTNVYLSPHETARNQCRAKRKIPLGTTIIKDKALSAVLIPSEKGKRCDNCFKFKQSLLKRCSSCAEYWYCGSPCQTKHWKKGHRHMCKKIPKYQASIDFQASPPHKQLDGILLSHLLAGYRDRLMIEDNTFLGNKEDDFADPFATFKSLLPLSTETEEEIPPLVIPVGSNIDTSVVKKLYSRFRNNNFLVHSHLNGIAHGIFPLASRLLNHSCIPNAAVSYSLDPEGISMSVMAISDIEPDDEIVIPYFDPALPYSTRRSICSLEYGFECACRNCSFFKTIGEIPLPPEVSSSENQRIEEQLLPYAFPDAQNICLPRDALLFDLPRNLYPILHEKYLPSISSTFTNASHDRQYELALRSGMILLGLYFIVYPPKYPQIGVQCLEIAKTAWNASTLEEEGGTRESDLRKAVRRFLDLAKESLIALESEGDDEDGPWTEYKMLDNLLKV